MENTAINSPYLFVSYADRDKELIQSLTRAMREDGYRLWYQDGISEGGEDLNTVSARLESAHAAVFFLSQNAVLSRSFRDELIYANKLEKPIFVIRLTETRLLTSMRMILQDADAVDFFRCTSLDDFLKKLHEVSLLKPCREEPKEALRNGLFTSFSAQTPFYRIPANDGPEEIAAINFTVPPLPTLMIGLGGIGSKTVHTVYKTALSHTAAPLHAIAVNDDPYELDSLGTFPAVAIPRVETHHEVQAIFDMLSTEEKTSLFTEDELKKLRKGNHIPLSPKKRAYLSYRRAELNNGFHIPEECLRQLIHEGHRYVKLLFVTSTIGHFGTSILIPLICHLTVLCRVIGIQPYVQVFLPSHAILPDHLVNFTVYHNMLATTHALLKELSFTAGSSNGGTLIHDIRIVPFRQTSQTLAENRAAFEIALTVELLSPTYTSAPAISELSVLGATFPKEDLLQRVTAEHGNRLADFSDYQMLKGIIERDPQKTTDDPDALADAVYTLFLTRKTENVLHAVLTSQLTLLDTFEKEVLVGLSDPEEDRALRKALTLPAPQKPGLLSYHKDKADLEERFMQAVNTVYRAILNYWKDETAPADHIVRAKKIPAFVEALFSHENTETLSALGLMEHGLFLSPTAAFERLCLFYRAVSERHKALCVALPDSRKRFSLSYSPDFDSAFSHAARKSHYYQSGKTRFLSSVPCRSAWDSVFYDLTVLQKDCQYLAEQQIDLRREYRETCARHLLYTALESKLDHLIRQYLKAFERTQKTPFSHADTPYLPHIRPLSFEEDAYRPTPDTMTENRVRDLFGRAFYTESFDAARHYPEAFRLLRDSLRLSPEMQALETLSIARTLCEGEDGYDPEAFHELVHAFDYSENHPLTAVVLPDHEADFFRENRNSILPDHRQCEILSNPIDPFSQSILFVFRSAFVRPDTYRYLFDPDRSASVYHAYRQLLYSPTEAPHVFAARNRFSAMPEIPEAVAKTQRERACRALVAAIVLQHAVFETDGDTVVLARYQKYGIETHAPKGAGTVFTQTFLKELYDDPDRISSYNLKLRTALMREELPLPIPNSEEDLPALIQAILKMPLVETLFGTSAEQTAATLSLVDLSIGLHRSDVSCFRTLYGMDTLLEAGLSLIHHAVENTFSHSEKSFDDPDRLIDLTFAALMTEICLSIRTQKSPLNVEYDSTLALIKAIVYPET